jgi:hypothetical protein
VSAWSDFAPLVGVVLGGAIAGLAPILADARRDARQARREDLRRERETADARETKRWNAALEGADAAQEALSNMVGLCVKVSGFQQIRSQADRDTFIVATKNMTLATSRVLDDNARALTERAARSLAAYLSAAKEGTMTPQLLDEAVASADSALIALGAVRRELFADKEGSR